MCIHLAPMVKRMALDQLVPNFAFVVRNVLKFSHSQLKLLSSREKSFICWILDFMSTKVPFVSFFLSLSKPPLDAGFLST